jgi:hypothetical protein
MTTPKHKVTGPKPERLKIEGNWKDAVKHALDRGKPPVKKKKGKKK